jgi:predicted GNAT family acetyltransferase
VSTAAELSVVDRPQSSRYEALLGDEVVAFADYEVRDSIVIMPHTVTMPAHRGNGFAGRVVQFALDDIRSHGRKVIASCWYVAQYIDEHAEYSDLRV